MTGLFSAPKSPPVQTTPDPPKKDDKEVEEGRRKAVQAAALAKGQSATILTGGKGANDDLPLSAASILTGRKAKLGD